MTNIKSYVKSNYYHEKLYPSTKFLFTLLLFFMHFIIPIRGIGYFIMIFNIIVSCFTGKFKSYMNQFIKILIPIVLLMFVFQLFIVRGNEILFTFGPLTATQEGLKSAITFSSNIGGIASSIMLFFQITSVRSIISSLQNANVNKNVIFVVNSTMQFLPQAKETAKTIKEAQESRGVEMEGSLMTRLKSFVPMITPLALSTISSNEEKVLTLESRGFSSKNQKTNLFSIQKRKRDKVISVIIIVLFILLVVGRVFIWR